MFFIDLREGERNIDGWPTFFIQLKQGCPFPTGKSLRSFLTKQLRSAPLSAAPPGKLQGVRMSSVRPPSQWPGVPTGCCIRTCLNNFCKDETNKPRMQFCVEESTLRGMAPLAFPQRAWEICQEGLSLCSHQRALLFGESPHPGGMRENSCAPSSCGILEICIAESSAMCHSPPQRGPSGHSGPCRGLAGKGHANTPCLVLESERWRGS